MSCPAPERGRRTVRIRRPPSSGHPRCGADERLVLATCTFAGGAAQDLLAGLSQKRRLRAEAHFASVANMESDARRALAHAAFAADFEVRPRLSALLSAVGPSLRPHLFDLLPPFHQRLFGDHGEAPPVGVLPPVVARVLRRRVLEATR